MIQSAWTMDTATLPIPGSPGPLPTVIARHQLAPAGAGCVSPTSQVVLDLSRYAAAAGRNTLTPTEPDPEPSPEDQPSNPKENNHQYPQHHSP